MIVYQARKSEFLHQVRHTDIEELIQEAFAKKLGRHVASSEVRSWQSSLLGPESADAVQLVAEMIAVLDM